MNCTRPTTITHPDGVSFTTGYDQTGAMRNAWWSSSVGTIPFLAVTLDSLGRRTSINRGSSYTGYSYDPASRLTGMSQSYTNGYGNTSVDLGYSPAG